MSGEDVYDVAVPCWCSLCEADHWPCETNEWGADIGMVVDAIAEGPGDG